MKFTVYENKWLRGGRAPNGEKAPSRLCNELGQMCCMGFLAEACGVPKKDLHLHAYWRGICYPTYGNHSSKLPAALRPEEWGGADAPTYCERILAEDIYKANDDNSCDETIKNDLTRLFAKAGIEVVFVAEAPVTEIEVPEAP